MNKKIITTLAILCCLIFMPISAKADYPTGTLGYSDDIVVGNEYEWSISKFDMTGDFATYTSYMTIGEFDLSEGAKIKLVITDDPDTAVGDWFEMYVNDVLLTGDPYSLSFFLGYGVGGFFINPVTYTNATGTYNIYEQILEELAENNIDETTGTSYEYGGVTFDYGATEVIEFSIKGDVFVLYMYVRMYATISGGGYDESMEMEISQEMTINTVTGLLGKIEVDANFDMGYMTGSVHLIIDSGYAATPYEWAFSFLGLTVIAAVVGLAKRKR
ncbi:MAG: hypothetical protein ACTSQF_11220 [Candidatus Heimdallarchaeaceae archaeon]